MGGGGGGAEEGGSGPGLKKLHLKKKVLESPEMARFAITKIAADASGATSGA